MSTGQQPTPSWAQPSQPPQPTKKAGCAKAAGIGCLGLIGLFLVIGVIGVIGAAVAGKSTSSSTKTAGPAAPASEMAKTPSPGTSAAGKTQAPPSQAPAPAAPQTLLTAHGSGIKNTAEFTTDSKWTLHYSFDCSAFGNQGNFIVSDESGMPLANELSSKGSGDSPQYTSGVHHLEINSECSWTVTVTAG